MKQGSGSSTTPPPLVFPWNGPLRDRKPCGSRRQHRRVAGLRAEMGHEAGEALYTDSQLPRLVAFLASASSNGSVLTIGEECSALAAASLG
jgi:hypothetical protein